MERACDESKSSNELTKHLRRLSISGERIGDISSRK